MAEYPIRKARTQQVGTAYAEGRILAQGVVSPEDVPAFARSMVDGYAVLADDVRSASPTSPVRLKRAGEVVMGTSTNLTLHAQEAIAVPTGGALPAGTTGLIKIEDTEHDGDDVVVLNAEHCEDRITQAASDVRAGELLFGAGAVLSPAAVGLLSAAGVANVTVYREAIVGIIVTGDELVPPGKPLASGQIHESNGVTICAALAAIGFAPRQYELVADEREMLASALAGALSECDAVVISGGSSVGDRDYAPAVIAAAGEPGVVVHGVRAKPGRPVLLAMVGERPVIGLPGNPVSALVMLETLAKPILLRMYDKTDEPLPLRARLQSTIAADPALEHRIPVQLLRGEGELAARPLLGSSSQLHILAYADAIIVVPEGSGGIQAGAWVDALPFSRTRNFR